MTKKGVVGTVGFIFVTIVLAKVLGQAREIVIAGLYGSSMQASAYAIASQMPTNFFDMILGSAISSAFIPVYNMFMQKEGPIRAKAFATRFLNLITLLTIGLSVFGIFTSPFIISIFAPKMDGEAQALASHLLQIMFPMIIFIGSAYTFVGILQSEGEFKIPAVMSVVSSAICIVYLFTLNSKFGIIGLAASLLLGWGLQYLVLIFPAMKRGFKYNFRAGIIDSGIKKVALLALPVLFATWVQPINALVNLSIASGISGGVAVAPINYANKIYIIAAGVFAIALTNYIFPKLSRLFVDGDKIGWQDTFISSLRSVILIVAPITIIFLINSTEIVRVLYERGAFDGNSVSMTSVALFFYSIGMISFAMQEVFNKGFYSRHNSKTPTIAAVGGIITNIILCITLSKFMGIGGLALSTSISGIVWSLFCFVIIIKNIDKNIVKSFFKYTVKIFVMFAVSITVTYFVRIIALDKIGVATFINRFTVLVICSISAFLSYGILAFAFKIEEMKFLGKLVRNIILKIRGGGNID